MTPLGAALDLAARGWAVFPCWERNYRTSPKTGEPEGAKSPHSDERLQLVNGHLDASRDPDQIRAWWSRWPKAMIGAPVPKSLLVIDVDPRNGGSLEELERRTGPLPETLIVWSGRNDGGQHLYFLRPPGPLTSTRLPSGIDLKVNGYCIVPPSTHPATGQPYRWEHHPVAPLPPRLRLLLCPAPKPVQTFTSETKNGSALIRKVAEATEGKRHDVLVWASFRAREDGILDDITDELIAAAVSTGETQTNARRTVASVRRAAS